MEVIYGDWINSEQKVGINIMGKLIKKVRVDRKEMEENIRDGLVMLMAFNFICF